MNTLYWRDFYGWAEQQYILFKNREYEKLDREHLLEEIGLLKIHEENWIGSSLKSWLTYKLMIIYMPEKHTKEWDHSICRLKRHFFNGLKDNPSIEPQLKEMLKESYMFARYRILIEYSLRPITESDIPEDCIFELEELLKEKDNKD